MPALSAAVLCLVVGISDGDTLKVRCGSADVEKVRLLQIDAPEKRQPFGSKAKEALSDLVHGRQVGLERGGRDRYGRTLGRVTVHSMDVNLEMVRRGYAWCYRRYLTDPRCLALEAAARTRHLGLWTDPDPVAPWNFRHPATRDRPR